MISIHQKTILVCKELFQARKQSIVSEEETDLGVELTSNAGVWLCVLPNVKLNVDVFKQYYQHILSRNIPHAILVHRDAVTPSVKKTIPTVGFPIELFHISEVQFNPTKHQFVPKHLKIPKTGHSEIDKYPILKRTDPIAKFYGFKIGDLIQITRKDGTIYYRVVRN